MRTEVVDDPRRRPPLDVAELVEVIAERTLHCDSTGQVVEELRNALNRLIDQRVQAALANLDRPRVIT